MSIEQINQQEIEKKWQDKWQALNVFAWDESESRANSFVIDTPPPTVSGLLHMGHVFSYTQTDFIARFQRMHGKNVFYPIGFDDNGLPTERLVEKDKKVKASDMARADFVDLCREVVRDYEKEFRELYKTLGISFDWAQEYQTVSNDTTALSQLSFLDLYNKGLIERREAPGFFDTVDRTAIAQAEIEDKERQGVMHYINFGQLMIATSRPELIPACVALLYNPEDPRYATLKGQHALTPIYNAQVPLIADQAVAIDKGTGLVMCCTFGDIQDIEWWRAHKLPLKSCITTTGIMKNAGGLDGLYVKDARKQILTQLEELGLLVKQENVTQFVKCAERSGAPLEIIPTMQWYIKLLDYKQDFIAKARACNWHPQYMRVRVENWINGLNQDWCISRQRSFGVPFPAWYSKRAGEEGRIILADKDQLPVDPLRDLPLGYARGEVVADMDVMDTWATSSITPMINSQAINGSLGPNHARACKLYPADLRPQAHEIIRTWAFYTIVKSHFHNDSIPWHNLMISGWCLASDKTKMSKSKGNIVTPRDLILSKGTDVIRYWASNSKLGVDITYSEEVFKIGHKLLTKLTNASKFVAMHLDDITGTPTTAVADIKSGIICESFDQWILSRLRLMLDKATANFLEYEYCDARVAIEDFFWNDFCDNYLELIKVRIYSADNALAKQSALYALSHCLNTLLRVLSPFMPHITEELNQQIFSGNNLLSVRGSWPVAENFAFDAALDQQGHNALCVLELVRKYKSLKNISLRTQLDRVTFNGCELDASMLGDLQNAANANSIASVAAIADGMDSAVNPMIKVAITEMIAQNVAAG